MMQWIAHHVLRRSDTGAALDHIHGATAVRARDGHNNFRKRNYARRRADQAARGGRKDCECYADSWCTESVPAAVARVSILSRAAWMKSAMLLSAGNWGTAVSTVWNPSVR